MTDMERREAARRQYAARKKPVKECSSCWVVGGHDPRCKKANTEAASRARRVDP